MIIEHNDAGSKKPPVVMIVDDEMMVTQTLKSLLELETDYEVLAHESPSEALRVLQTQPADLVISDFLMPDMDGLQFLSQVKRMHPDIPLILLTGYADKENAIKALNEVGLYQYIEKPWDNDHLKLTIRNGLNSKSLNRTLKQKISELDNILLQVENLSQQNTLLTDELAVAREVQLSLLPKSLPAQDRLQLATRYTPALEIGGDFYDIIPLQGDKIAALIADVTGHGIQAALSTVLIKLGFSRFAGEDVSPGDILAGMNKVLSKGLPQGVFAAAIVAVIDVQSGECRVANAGTPHPSVLRRRAKDVERVPVNGLLLGIVDSNLFPPADEVVTQLAPDDCLILYSDGVCEVHNDRSEEFYTDGMQDTLLLNIDQPGDTVIDTLVQAARKFSSPKHEWDDITIIAIERKR